MIANIVSGRRYHPPFFTRSYSRSAASYEELPPVLIKMAMMTHQHALVYPSNHPLSIQKLEYLGPLVTGYRRRSLVESRTATFWVAYRDSLLTKSGVDHPSLARYLMSCANTIFRLWPVIIINACSRDSADHDWAFTRPALDHNRWLNLTRREPSRGSRSPVAQIRGRASQRALKLIGQPLGSFNS